MSDLNVEMRGQGPDLVLLHGWGLNLRVWDGLTRELAKHFRVIAVDLPGHGRSAWNPKARTPAEQAWQVHAALASRSDRYSLLGWSLGGQIALDLAAAMPGNVERLVLVATTPRFAAGEDWPHGMAAAALDKLATQLRTNYKRTVSEFLELQVRGSAAGDKVLADLHASLFSHGEAHPKALVAGLATLKSSDLRSMLSLIRTPALVIAGQYDRVTLPAASRALAAALPDARYVEFRRAAHAPFLSHTAEFAALVTQFLQGKPIEGTSPSEGKQATDGTPDKSLPAGAAGASVADRPLGTERASGTDQQRSTAQSLRAVAALDASPDVNAKGVAPEGSSTATLAEKSASLKDAFVAERILAAGDATAASKADASSASGSPVHTSDPPAEQEQSAAAEGVTQPAGRVQAASATRKRSGKLG